MERNFVTFSTGMFLDEQPDDELNHWFLGEDCARWLQSKLLAVEGITPGVEPFEEDWGGWMFGVRCYGIWFWILIWPGLEEPHTWIIGIERGLRGAFLKKRTRVAKAELCDAVDSALESSPDVAGRRWLDKHPLG